VPRLVVGCTAWAFTAPRYDPPYEDAIRHIGELGFKGIELILHRPEDLEDYWTPKRIEEIVRLYRSYGLTLSQFAIYQDAIADLPSLDPSERQRAFDNFERGVKLAKALGADAVNFVAQWPLGLEAPIAYPPNYYYVQVPGLEGFSPKLTMKLPPGFDWDAIWTSYVDAVGQCTALAKSHGLRLALEGHANVIVPHTDSFLRLFDRLPDPALGANFDVGWQFVQREYVPWSIHKLKGKIFNVHARDGDGLLAYGLPPGLGILDWEEILKALLAVGYEGFLSLELGRYAEPARWLAYGLDYLEALIERLGA
jgi:sugar phosphate isomerase/epimerase